MRRAPLPGRGERKKVAFCLIPPRIPKKKKKKGVNAGPLPVRLLGRTDARRKEDQRPGRVRHEPGTYSQIAGRVGGGGKKKGRGTAAVWNTSTTLPRPQQKGGKRSSEGLLPYCRLGARRSYKLYLSQTQHGKKKKEEKKSSRAARKHQVTLVEWGGREKVGGIPHSVCSTFTLSSAHRPEAVKKGRGGKRGGGTHRPGLLCRRVRR